MMTCKESSGFRQDLTLLEAAITGHRCREHRKGTGAAFLLWLAWRPDDLKAISGMICGRCSPFTSAFPRFSVLNRSNTSIDIQ